MSWFKKLLEDEQYEERDESERPNELEKDVSPSVERKNLTFKEDPITPHNRILSTDQLESFVPTPLYENERWPGYRPQQVKRSSESETNREKERRRKPFRLSTIPSPIYGMKNPEELERKEEEERLALEAKQEEERLALEAKRKEEEERLALEAKQEEEERLALEAKQEEEERLALEAKQEEERLALEAKRKEEEERLALEAKQEEEERLALEAKRKEEERLALEAKRKEEEERLALEEKQIDDEQIDDEQVEDETNEEIEEESIIPFNVVMLQSDKEKLEKIKRARREIK